MFCLSEVNKRAGCTEPEPVATEEVVSVHVETQRYRARPSARDFYQPCATIFCSARVHVKVGHVYPAQRGVCFKTLTRLTQSVTPGWERAWFQPPCLKHVERHLVGVHNRTSLVRLLPPSALLWETEGHSLDFSLVGDPLLCTVLLYLQLNDGKHSHTGCS